MAFLSDRALAGKPVYIKPPTVGKYAAIRRFFCIDSDRQGYYFTLSAGRQKCSRALHRRGLRAATCLGLFPDDGTGYMTKRLISYYFKGKRTGELFLHKKAPSLHP